MNSELIMGEFDDAGLGDIRLDHRLQWMAVQLSESPDASFPAVFQKDADLEGCYRLLSNDRVTPEAVMGPHVQATVDRASAFSTVLAVHDTTQFEFHGERAGLGVLNKSGRGFLGHMALLVEPTTKAPLGVAALHTWVRTTETTTAKRKRGELNYSEAASKGTEQERWSTQVDEVESVVCGATSLIHVADSEADDYKLLSALVNGKRRFAVRLCYDRALAENSTEWHKTKEFMASAQVVAEREVAVSKRRRQPGGDQFKRTAPRQKRMATLAVSAARVEFRRPGYLRSYPKTLPVHLVQAREINTPKGQIPIEWIIITSEPIDTVEEILRVLDYYSERWTIEEYFDALKNGCAVERRQLESLKTLRVALAMFIPIAWCLLHLRTLSRSKDPVPAIHVLTPVQIEVLRRSPIAKLPDNATARDALLAIARLGGHIKQNGDPGWRVLSRGFRNLILLTVGFFLGQAASAKM